MSNKLCPFCGGDDCVKSSGDGFPLIPNCLFESKSYVEVVEKYNVRPLENALQAKIDETHDTLSNLIIVIPDMPKNQILLVVSRVLESLEIPIMSTIKFSGEDDEKE